MKKKEKVVILVLLVITIALVVLGIVTKNDKATQTAKVDNKQSNTEEEESLDEEHVVTLEDGTRLSTSKALKKEKSFDGIKVTDIQLTEKKNKTVLLGTLTNTANTKKGGYYVNVVLKDEEGNALKSLRTYINELEAGETTQLNTQVTLDYANAYDFSVEL